VHITFFAVAHPKHPLLKLKSTLPWTAAVVGFPKEVLSSVINFCFADNRASGVGESEFGGLTVIGAVGEAEFVGILVTERAGESEFGGLTVTGAVGALVTLSTLAGTVGITV
jgi:hypothetical protein